MARYRGRRWLLTCGLTAAITACTVGPDYQAPKVTVPDRWQAHPPGSEGHRLKSLSEWWRGFHDSGLNRLIDRALTENPDLAAAKARVQVARAEAAMTDAELWPSLNTSAAYQRELISRNALLGALGSIQNLTDTLGTGKNRTNPGLLSPLGPIGKPFNLFLAGFDSSWELDLFGGIARRVEAAQAKLAAVDAERADLEITLTAEVARLYLEIVALECRGRIARARLAGQEEATRLAEASYVEGLVGLPDVRLARSRLAQERTVPPILENQSAQYRHALTLLLGLKPGALAGEWSRMPDAVPLPPAIPSGLPADLLRRRPDIRRAEREVAAATAMVGAAVAELFPKISLTGAVGFQSQELSNFVNPSSGYYGFGPRLSLPIFQAGRLKAQVTAREAMLEEAIHLYEKTVLNSFREVEDQLSGLRSENERRAGEAQAVTESEAANRGTEAYYREGETDLQAVLDARRTWHDAEERKVQSSVRWAIGHIALIKALGGGWLNLSTGEK